MRGIFYSKSWIYKFKKIILNISCIIFNYIFFKLSLYSWDICITYLHVSKQFSLEFSYSSLYRILHKFKECYIRVKFKYIVLKAVSNSDEIWKILYGHVDVSMAPLTWRIVPW